MSQPCVYCSRPKSSRIQGRNNVLTSSLHAIERYALNDKGVIGSLYDALRDDLLSTLCLNENSIVPNNVKEIPTCNLIKVDDTNRDDLLQNIGIQGDLRVSIALNMTSVIEGISALHTFDLPADRIVRIIDYYHVGQEDCLSGDRQRARSTLPDSIPNNCATHIITSVKRGFDFVIVLELPENPNHDEIDPILEKLCEFFIQPRAAFLSIENQQKINNLKPTIYTRITTIRSFKENEDLSEICRYLHQYVHYDKHNFTLSYTLHPIACIYPDTPSGPRVFLQFDQYVIQKIEQAINPLSNGLKTIERLFQEKLPSQLSKCFQTPVEKIHKDIDRVKSMYTGVQRRSAEVVVQIRRGKSNLSLLNNELYGAEMKSFVSELQVLQTKIRELQTEVSLITKYGTDRQTKYPNTTGLKDLSVGQASLEDTCKKFPIPLSLPTTQSVIKPVEVNILLIGETGVGKSTFINALVNYLAFHSLQQATHSEPVVLIPVSFVITVGDHFQEKKIEFGQFDANENHNESGQSVTQYCKSYIFTIKNNTKLRIIDTPGIGDTRGAEQDNQNIDHILSYTSHLPHLNAICFLLKPNTTRLHALFRSCFTQLFNFLGPNARENIIFCFTNTRATFYAPGDTAKLLKTMLNELPIDHKPSFAKENTFCFDSESFRYLAVMKNGHTLAFDENQKLDFERSWKMSVAESIRLLDCIRSRPQYPMNKWHSMRHAQLMITLLVRPILETIRNSIRNLILWDLEDKQKMIELKAQFILLPAWLCTGYPCIITTTENISNITYPIHNYQSLNRYAACRYASGEHLPIFYELQYRSSDTKGTGFYAETEKTKNRLIYASVLLSQFLLYTAEISQNPFLMWLDLFIREQEHLCSKQPTEIHHSKLLNKLRDEKDKYVNDLQDIKRGDDRLKLDAVYNCMEEILVYPVIAEQMHAIKTNQMKMMKNNEHDISSQYPHLDSFL